MMKRHTLLATLLLSALGSSAHAGVGLRMLEVGEPITAKQVPVAVFYPSDQAADNAMTQVGPNRIAAERNAAPQAGRHPLIVLSHGHGGSMWGHRDLAASLARHGYVVAAVEHRGDSWNDLSGVGTDRALRGRAYQASAAITAVLADPAFAPLIDASRIGAAGFSAGGYTTLVLLGAKPDFSLWRGYCKRQPQDEELCGQGVPSARRMNALRDPPPMADRRVKAAFAMAPLGIFFGPGAFDAVDAPVYLYEAANDEILLPQENSRAVQRGLKSLHAFRSMPKAGHYVFLAPCAPALAQEAPQLCNDPPGVDRVAVHAQVMDDAQQFFDAVLKPAVGKEGAAP